MHQPKLEVRRLGRVGYADALALQKELEEKVIAERAADYLLLLEHPHTFTLGRRSTGDGVLATADRLRNFGVEVFEINRGGRVTYHGLGQIVGYPIISLSPDREDVHRYVRDLEQVLIDTMSDFGIDAFRVEGLTGVHTAEGKVAAIGVHIKRWVTTHGFALNVNTDLSYYNWIIACEGEPVTSMERLLGREIELPEVEDRLEANFRKVFGYNYTPLHQSNAAAFSRGNKLMKLSIVLLSVLLIAACGEAPKPTPPSNATASPSATIQQELTAVDRPAKIADQVSMRGEQDAASPTLTIVEPRANAVLTSSTVKVQLTLAGDLKGYQPHMDETTKMGNHIHVILDNQPYEAYYNLGQPFELRNVMDGEHILRVFPSRPWHESYKNDGGFQAVKFTVKNGGGDPSKPATTGGQPMSGPTPEGKDVKPSNAGKVDLKKPLLTYSRPKGEYKVADADAIMIDFWLTNAKLAGDGGEYRVKYTLNGGQPKFIDKWSPIWLSGWLPGTHNLMLELVDKDGNLVDNGGYNQTTREITVAK